MTVLRAEDLCWCAWCMVPEATRMAMPIPAAQRNVATACHRLMTVSGRLRRRMHSVYFYSLNCQLSFSSRSQVAFQMGPRKQSKDIVPRRSRSQCFLRDLTPCRGVRLEELQFGTAPDRDVYADWLSPGSPNSRLWPGLGSEQGTETGAGAGTGTATCTRMKTVVGVECFARTE